MITLPNAKTVIYRVKDFDLTRTLTSGQTFGWTRVSGSRSVFSGEIRGMAVTCREPREGFFRCRIFKGSGVGSSAATAPPITTDTDTAVIAHYFDLERDYSALASKLIVLDATLAPVIASGRGLRLLRQDPWETLISFIISAHNNVPRICKSVLALKASFGVPLVPGAKAYAFPSAQVLGEAAEEELIRAGLGFRVRYVKAASAVVVKGEVDLSSLNDLSTEEARSALMSIPGVGRKVADCVLLYAYGRTEVFPVDVWVKRAVETLYFDGQERPVGYIIQFAADRWGPYAGFVQLYLFDYFRRTGGNR